MFEAFGVRPEAELAYRLLLRRGEDTGPLEAAQLLSPSTSEQVFAELVEAGLLTATESGWAVVPPERAADVLSARAERELEARRRAIDRARHEVGSAVADFVDSHREADTACTEVVRGSDAVRSRLHQLSQGARDRAWTINPGPAPPTAAIDASRAMDRMLRGNQVRQRTVVSDASLSCTAFREYLHGVVNDGDRVRVHPAPPARLLLFDATTAVVPLIENAPEIGALVVHERSLVAPLTALFDQTWAQSLPFDARPDASGDAGAAGADPEGARVRQVVAMLATGHTDTTIARELGVSTRTVGRLVAEAGRRLQTTSRIEICILALRAGWIPDTSVQTAQDRSD